jgi:hypothetical protein
MYELLKNIGLGLFVNGSYAIMNGDISPNSVLITLLSAFIMWGSIKLEKDVK